MRGMLHVLLKAESLFPGEDSSEKLPPSKL